MPDDAKNITTSCSKQQTNQAADREKQQMDMLLARTEDEDLNAAILASLLDAIITGDGSGTSTAEAIEGGIEADKDSTEQESASTGSLNITKKNEDDPNVHG
jgi:hypothetical protein